MSDVTDQYLLWARSRAEKQYESLRRALGITLQRQRWQVERINFIAGAAPSTSMTEEQRVFEVPEASIESIGSKLAMRIFDEYANILKCMYRTRFNGAPPGQGTSLEAQPTPETVTPSLIRTLESGGPLVAQPDPHLSSMGA